MSEQDSVQAHLLAQAMHYLTHEVIFINDEQRNVMYVTPSIERLLGYSVDEFKALEFPNLIHPDDLAAATETSTELRSNPGSSYRTTLRMLHKEGTFRWFEVVGRNLLNTEVGGIINTLRDVSDRRALEEQLLHQAMYDELSGLANRRKFLGELQRALAVSHIARVGLLMIDIDGFKPVNDQFGHATGDKLIRKCAQKIQRALRPGDLAARLGGDEFAILCHRVEGSDSLRTIAERVLAEASGEYTLDEGAVTIGISIGAALGSDRDAPVSVMAKADDALYKAKADGRNRVVLATH